MQPSSTVILKEEFLKFKLTLKEECGFEIQSWIFISALSLTSCVTRGKLHNFSKPQVSSSVKQSWSCLPYRVAIGFSEKHIKTSCIVPSTEKVLINMSFSSVPLVAFWDFRFVIHLSVLIRHLHWNENCEVHTCLNRWRSVSDFYTEYTKTMSLFWLESGFFVPNLIIWFIS